MQNHFDQTTLRDGGMGIEEVHSCRERLCFTNGCRSKTCLLLAVLSATAATLFTSVCADELAYDSYEIDIGTDAEVLFRFTGSFTGRDVDDIVIVTMPEEEDVASESDGSQETRKLSIYSHDGDVFSRVISTEITRGLMDTWRFKEGVALLSAQSRRIDKFDLNSKTFRPWLEIGESDPQQRSTEPEFLFNFSRDLNGDGLDDIVYVVEESLFVRIQLPDGKLAEPVVLSTTPEADLRISYQLDSPQTLWKAAMYSDVAFALQYSLYPFDFDGDGVGDLAFPSWDQFGSESQDEGENETARDDSQDEEEHGTVQGTTRISTVFGLRIHRGLDGREWAAHPLSLRAPTISLGEGIPIHLFEAQDFNDDGIGDVATFGLDDPPKSLMSFFFGRRDGDEIVFGETADTSVAMKGWLVMMTDLSDLDRDGDVDFCVVPMDIEAGQAKPGLLRKSTHVTLSCYLMTDGVYPEEPSMQLSKTRQPNVPSPDALGDVTGDGILDVVVATRKNRLEVFAGTGDGDLFATDPMEINLELPDYGDAIIFRDLNRDGKADMLVYPLESGLPIWVALSR